MKSCQSAARPEDMPEAKQNRAKSNKTKSSKIERNKIVWKRPSEQGLSGTRGRLRVSCTRYPMTARQTRRGRAPDKATNATPRGTRDPRKPFGTGRLIPKPTSKPDLRTQSWNSVRLALFTRSSSTSFSCKAGQKRQHPGDSDCEQPHSWAHNGEQQQEGEEEEGKEEETARVSTKEQARAREIEDELGSLEKNGMATPPPPRRCEKSSNYIRTRG